MEQKHIVLAGAGMMGASLSQVYAQAGYQVSLEWVRIRFGAGKEPDRPEPGDSPQRGHGDSGAV